MLYFFVLFAILVPLNGFAYIAFLQQVPDAKKPRWGLLSFVQAVAVFGIIGLLRLLPTLEVSKAFARLLDTPLLDAALLFILLLPLNMLAYHIFLQPVNIKAPRFLMLSAVQTLLIVSAMVIFSTMSNVS